MGWVRCILISNESIRKSVIKTLEKSYKYKQFHSNEGFDLFAYEGRAIAEFDSEHTLTMGVDGRNPIYYVVGNSEHATHFNAAIEVVCGFTTTLTARNLAKKKAKLNNLIKNLVSMSSEVYESEDEDSFCCRFDTDPQSLDFDDLMENLELLTEEFSKQDWPIFTALFDEGFGNTQGTLDEPSEGIYTGPSAYAMASWSVKGPKSKVIEFELTLNESESLLNGNGIDELN